MLRAEACAIELLARGDLGQLPGLLRRLPPEQLQQRFALQLVMAHIHLSWLDPRKERRLTLVCSKKMVEFDDVAAEKLRIYDKGYDRPPEFSQYAEYLTIRQGDIHIPHLAMAEPLSIEARHFLDCCAGKATPRSDVASGLRGVRILAAAQASLARDGSPVALAP